MKRFTFLLGLLLTTGSLMADEAVQAAAAPQQNWKMLIMFGVGIVLFYFILMRPEQKRRKAMELQRSSIKKGDRVTAMGIVGHVARIQDTTVVLRMIDGSKIEVVKGAISEVHPGTEEDLKKVEKEEAKPAEIA